MKPILLVSEFFPPDPGGIQRSLELLAPAWGRDVRVITPVRQNTFPGLQRSLFSGRVKPRWLWLIPEFWRKASRHRRLIVFGHFSAAVIAAWVLRPFGVRYVVLTHGNDLLVEQRRWWPIIITYVLRGAEWIGVNSTWLSNRIIKVGVPASKIIRTHPAVADDELTAQLGPRCEGMILTIARLVPRKNISLVLSAVAKIIATHPTVQYHVVGDGPERTNLQQQAEKLGIQKHIVWHGHANESTRRDLLHRATIFILTPIERQGGTDIEGLGAVYLEAAAAGLPIIATDTGGVADAVRNEDNGLLLRHADAEQLAAVIIRLLDHPEDRKKFGQAGRELVEREFRVGVRTNRAKHLLQDWPEPEQPKISIIIPAYNSTKTIVDTLASVWAQTWKRLEVIVVDDGSTDNLAATLGKDRSNITLIRQENSGAPAARNRGAAEATGRWWLFLDADTVLAPDALMLMATVLEAHPEAAYAYSDFRFGVKTFHLHDFSDARLRRLNYIHTTSLLRPEAWPGFDPTLQRFQDWDLWLTMLQNGHRGIWIPRELFRIRDEGTMSRWVPSFVYRLPAIGRGIGNSRIKKYRQAEAIIRKKHNL